MDPHDPADRPVDVHGGDLMQHRVDVRSLVRTNAPRLTVFRVPEWDTVVYLRRLSVSQAIDARRKVQQDREAEAIVDVVLAGVCDVTGRPWFTEQDREALGSYHGHAVIERLATAVLTGSEPTPASLDAAEKN